MQDSRFGEILDKMKLQKRGTGRNKLLVYSTFLRLKIWLQIKPKCVFEVLFQSDLYYRFKMIESDAQVHTRDPRSLLSVFRRC